MTNMSEFASGPAISTLGGQIHNPHALDRTPAGSSGGNGAGLAVSALGTDTGGSIRGPAAVNGIIGLKPTFGLTGRGGIVPLALSRDTVGPTARHVADLAAALNVMVGPDPRDSAAVTRGNASSTNLCRERVSGLNSSLCRARADAIERARVRPVCEARRLGPLCVEGRGPAGNLASMAGRRAPRHTRKAETTPKDSGPRRGTDASVPRCSKQSHRQVSEESFPAAR